MEGIFIYILNDTTVSRLARWGRNVWNIDPSLDEYSAAHKAIEAYEGFLKEMGLPTRLRELRTAIPQEMLLPMAEDLYPSLPAKKWFKPLNSAEELAEVFRLAY